MKKSKKIVLFIVEGVTDETSLALIISKIIENNKKVKFKVVRTDITIADDVTSTNIINKLTKQVNEFVKTDIYIKSDIIEIVHIVDTDGAFIDNTYIKYKESKINYTTENIEVCDIDSIINRNIKKTKVINRLISTDSIYNGIPYKVYFFSCNLEHVLHNIQNVPREEKEYYAFEFTERFVNNPEDFIQFINNSDFAIDKNYKESWDFIKTGTNSLKRFTNFHLFINSLHFPQ